jgi:hypothetical protein
MSAYTKSNLRSRPIYLDLSDMSVPPVQVVGQHRNLEHKCMYECFSAQYTKKENYATVCKGSKLKQWDPNSITLELVHVFLEYSWANFMSSGKITGNYLD